MLQFLFRQRSYNKIVGYIPTSQPPTMKNQLQNSQKISPTAQNPVNSNKSTHRDYRGMTLKEYFRLSQAHPFGKSRQIKQTDQENVSSSQEAGTPNFNNSLGRHKIKTEVCEQNSFCEDKPVFLSKEKANAKQALKNQAKTRYLKMNKQQIEMLPLPVCTTKQKNNIAGKRVATLSSYHKQHLNRSTITSFYQIESKKKRMLDKVKQERERINEMKLSDAFFITKYAQKFHLDGQNKRKSPF